MTRGSELTTSAHRELAALLRSWLPEQRWFAGKGHDLTAVEICEAFPMPGQTAVVNLVVGVELDADHWQTYQVPISIHPEPHPDLMVIGPLGDAQWVHDALRDPAALPALLAPADAAPEVDPGVTHQPEATGHHPAPRLQSVPGSPGYAQLPSRPLGVEQSNSSIVVGDVALVKFFRRLTPGINPDVEVHAALGVARCPSVGHALGWVNGGWREPPAGRWVTGHTAMVQQLLTDAAEGWDLALRRLSAGEAFDAEAHALGRATAQVHGDLREVLPSRVLARGEVAEVADRLHWRLDQAIAVVAELSPHGPRLHQRIDAVASLDQPFRVQRVHGDLHLQQVMRAADGWKLLDFEGEPGSPIAERVAPDHPLRDVAGMLRSFAYAAAQGGAGRDAAEVGAWLTACQSEFLAGYAEGAGGSGAELADDPVLSVYLLDKAAYEAAYEKRNRPDWLHIPMAALDRLAQ